MIDHPFSHGLKTDPRADVRKMYDDEKTRFFSNLEMAEVIESNQVTIFERQLHEGQMTQEIINGQSPSRQKLDFIVSLMTSGHHLRVNDVLSESVNTCLARMQDSGIVEKIFSKYYMTNSKSNTILLHRILQTCSHQLTVCYIQSTVIWGEQVCVNN